MKKEIYLFIAAVSALAMLVSIQPEVELTLSDSAEENRETENRGRAEYFFTLMRNPETNEIPKGIRSSEINHAQTLPTVEDFKGKNAIEYEFTEVGPSDVGGRTRALAVDVRNSDIIIAGGVSGGIWKSTDGGQSWTRRTRDDQLPMVSFVAQDPRPGFQDIWYYTTGERNGNSASDRGFQAVYGGHGIYRSIDNGDSWELLDGTANTINGFDSCFDYGIKVEVSPVSGTVFVATAVCGIFRSTDGITWNDFNPDLGGTNEHSFSDVEIASDGTIYAVLSSTVPGSSTQTNSPGIYESTDDGVTWVDITPAEMPDFHDRTRLAVAPSNPDILYAFIEGTNASPNLLYIDRSQPTNTELRTNNIPDYNNEDPGPVGPGNMNLQGGYNMTIAVNPANENQVMIGGTNLFRSNDGFTTAPEIGSGWIGGYGPDDFLYPNHHPDQHVMFFDPNNPARLFSGHDGGIGVTENINGGSITWTSLNNDYNVTQFYTVAISPIVDDDRIVGGTQDNGSPYFRFDLQNGTQASEDVSSGDGSYASLRYNSGFVSSQRGNIFRLFYQDDTGDLFSPFTTPGRWTRVQPDGATGQLFIHPYLVDFGSENLMFYPSEGELYRNTNVSSIPDFNGGNATEGWEKITDFNVNNSISEDRDVTSMDISRLNPARTLYVAGSDRSGERNLAPTIKKILNSSFNTEYTDVSIPGLPGGAYIHDVTVNPLNGEEVIVAVSNYGVESIFHTTDGGNTWVSVEGNLATQSPNQEGPSVRAVSIAEIDTSTTIYFAGTSTGLYSTQSLEGDQTQWVRESPSGIGLHVVEYLDYRPDDNLLAVATHGRGLFVGKIQDQVSNEQDEITAVPENFTLDQNYPNPFNPSTNISFSLPQSSQVTLSVYDINGRLVAEILNNEIYSGGQHEINFDASSLASGVYLYNLRAVSFGGQAFTQSRTMTLIK